MLMCTRHHHIEGLTKDSSRNYGYAMYEKVQGERQTQTPAKTSCLGLLRAGWLSACAAILSNWKGHGPLKLSDHGNVHCLRGSASHPRSAQEVCQHLSFLPFHSTNSSSFCAKPQCSLEYTLKTLPAQHRAQNTMKQSMGYLQGRFTCQDNCQLDQKRGTDPRGLLQTRFLIKSNF